LKKPTFDRDFLIDARIIWYTELCWISGNYLFSVKNNLQKHS